jgi:hypothetical protein
VSGPAAAEYLARTATAARFAGRVVNTVRNAERLLARNDPSIHHGEAMTCVWRAETALCRKERAELGLAPNETADESRCRSTCQNLAYTDRDIQQLRDRLTCLQARAADPLSPRPLRDRVTDQVADISRVIERHGLTRSTDQHTIEGS